MKLLKGILLVLVALIALVFILIYFNVLWLMAPSYDVKQYIELKEPIMDMLAYEEIWETHRRPYIYSVLAANGGGVWVMGVEHSKDVDHPQMDSIRYYWEKAQPNLALAEGGVGNLVRYLQHPIKTNGEGGLLRQLADDAGVELYSWEPRREIEIELLMRDFPVEQIAMFYTLRPYFSNMRFGRPDSPEAALQDYLNSRTDYKHLRGVYTSWTELDSIWQRDFPDKDWREHSSGNGWPKGYLHSIWNKSNVARDEHMVQIILEAVGEGKTVFVTMGASHAPRVEKTLRAELE
ncbi:MAG: hypothetical protein ACRBF0_23655 [Calditrichia bacterium]